MRSSVPVPAEGERKAPTYTEKDRAKLLADIEKIRPQVDEYRTRIDEIAAEFEDAMRPILRPDQLEKYESQLKRYTERRLRGEREVAETALLTDKQIFDLQQRPLWNALWNVAINWRLERMTKELTLDEEQQNRCRELLRQRREKFLALVDSTPPPSITLSQLAPQANKLGAPARTEAKK